jgi:uncharacterized membrane protein
MRITRACLILGLAVWVASLPAFPVQAAGITILGQVPGGAGYTFTNFDGPVPSTTAGTGTNMNGISNAGVAVGFSTPDGAAFTNFTANPRTSTTATLLTPPLGSAAMALGINSKGEVVGTDGAGNAFSLLNGTVTTLAVGTPAMAFGINDKGMIVGQETAGGHTPGFVLDGTTLTTINAPAGSNSNIVNAQGINNNGLIVGFYAGNDGNQHGFMANLAAASGGMLTGTKIADPTIIPQEPGATFVFSQILGINDHGLAVGYYGDSTGSQHGFLYNTLTGTYTFLDDPSARIDPALGTVITQITGITNDNEITGFYSTADGVFHGFVATVPEPGSVVLMGLGLAGVAGYLRHHWRRTRAHP